MEIKKEEKGGTGITANTERREHVLFQSRYICGKCENSNIIWPVLFQWWTDYVKESPLRSLEQCLNLWRGFKGERAISKWWNQIQFLSTTSRKQKKKNKQTQETKQNATRVESQEYILKMSVIWMNTWYFNVQMLI